jgi:hypothetical protein
MAPAPGTRDIGRHQLRRPRHGQLVAGKADNRFWGQPRVFEEGAEHADRAKLSCNAEAIVVTAMLADKSTVGIVEVEVPGQLIVARITEKLSVPTCLLI